MTYLLSQFWIFILLAVALGLFVGWAARSASPDHEPPNWMFTAAILTAVGVLAAVMYWFRDFFGLALEVALLLFASYVAGCAIGCRLHMVRESDLEAATEDHAHHAH